MTPFSLGFSFRKRVELPPNPGQEASLFFFHPFSEHDIQRAGLATLLPECSSVEFFWGESFFPFLFTSLFSAPCPCR